MSSSSELEKRKNIVNSNPLPLEKQKLYNNIKIISPSSFSSIICIDDYDEEQSFTTLCISNSKKVFSFGYTILENHGHKETFITIPKQIKGIENIKMISCGIYHSICLNYEGDVFSFGCNDYGQLGIGKHINELEQTHIPQKINLPPCKQVSCGDNFTICLIEDDKLYSFGDNNYGQLALGNNETYSSPQLIPDLNNIQLIVCGYYFSICKTYNNEFYSWGYNYLGQLGQGNNDNCNKPIQCYNWPDNIIDIKSGGSHSLLLTSEGYIYSFGWNSFGQLGMNDKNIRSINTPTLIKHIPEIQRIECGFNHSMCIDINDNLWICGANDNGQLGLGDTGNRYKPILHPTLSNIIDISSRGYHTFVKTIDNKIYAFGNNNYSQLGIETSKEHQLTPIQVLEGKEDIWCSTIGKNKQKSAQKKKKKKKKKK